MREIDCRGLACPQPVLETKEALEGLSEGEVLRVLVDNEAAVQNVSRFVSSQGYPLQVREEAGYFILEVVKKGRGRPVEGVSCERPEGIFRVILVDSDRMGEGDEELGRKLMVNFLQTLPQVSPLPQALIFYNRGVFLTVEGSPVLSALRELEGKGVKILSCWTCLSHYDLEDKLRVGQASNMYEILSLLMRADRVLRP
ncbi:MAG TPA: sulfurtransferase-like selenium metabolism protein YedF [Thermosulfurimonas dismutans]|uniref:Sulfurtransferase-like selenium metabolism protein YedF n=1 Tax=Thermosulfurimonas dismutans TaxID=999894 RepID=A0A7C3GIH2_9BACT|nr:sulfurtransferase-like selenium metabolism protein YedF [Thermosulfurimonas dismutans]